MKDRQIDAEIKKGIDARTKEFKEKITKLAYERIKKQLSPALEPLKGYPHNESMLDESVNEAKKLGSRVKITKGRFAGKSGIIRQMDNGRFKGDAKSFDIDLDDGKEANGVTGKDIKIVKESAGDAVQGLNDLGNKMKGRDQKDIRRIEKLYRSGNSKVFQGAIRALDTDLRDQVKDIFDALGMVKNGVIESVDLNEGKMKRNPLIDNNPDVKAARKAHADGTWDGNVDKEGEAIVHIKGKPYTVTNKFESVDEGTLPPALQAYQDKKNGKKKKDDKDEDVKEHTISIDEQIIEALKAGKGKGVADIDYVGDPKLTKKIEKMFKVKIKQTGTTTADVTGEKKNILTFLQKHYYYDNLDVMELHPEIVEANESTQMKKVSDMSERAMTLKQIAQKYKGEISKSQKSGNPDLYLKKAEKELVAWAMDNNEISGKDSDEEDDWLANVVSDKKQFDALLKFSRT